MEEACGLQVRLKHTISYYLYTREAATGRAGAVLFHTILVYTNNFLFFSHDAGKERAIVSEGKAEKVLVGGCWLV